MGYLAGPTGNKEKENVLYLVLTENKFLFPFCSHFNTWHNYGGRRECKIHFARRMASCGMVRRVALVRADVSEELSASFIRVTRTGEGGATFLRNVGFYKSHMA
jgi:hypothetical protein